MCTSLLNLLCVSVSVRGVCLYCKKPWDRFLHHLVMKVLTSWVVRRTTGKSVGEVVGTVPGSKPAAVRAVRLEMEVSV